jgi:thiol:disulfide interchange protein DsbD
VDLGVALDIEEGWHLYWDGQNDSGLPLSVKPLLPEGYVAGELQWPAPSRRVVSPGDILDHVYEGRVTLILPVRVPVDARPGTTEEVACRLSWIACREVCVSGEAAVRLSLPVGVSEPGAVPRDDAGRFREARARIPRPPSEGDGIRFLWEWPRLTVMADGARSLAFFPREDCARPVALIEEGSASSGRLQLRFRDPDGEDRRIAGVLEVVRGSGRAPGFYIVDLPLPDHL